MDKINRFLGSPPHTWRILPVVDFEADDGGITSTYVENTTVVSLVVNTSKDHLHIRGEYLIHLWLNHMQLGSPPHTWRILWVPLLADPIVRDHLHIRGEYYFSRTTARIGVGSPPHTWRIPSVISIETVNIRITSTYVENTLEQI